MSACAESRRQVARLAAGIALGQQGFGLARHVRACARCEAFVDRIARARAWLAGGIRPPYEAEGEGVERRLHEALARQLCARLARDLLALGGRGAPRPRDVRARDWGWLAALRGGRALARPPFGLVRAILLDEVPGSSAAELAGLARALDPLGFDIALAHLTALERRGHADQAHAEVDRLLGLVVGEPEGE